MTGPKRISRRATSRATGAGLLLCLAFWPPAARANDHCDTRPPQAAVNVGIASAKQFRQEPYVVTPWDQIPNFAQFPTISSETSGPWSAPTTWNPRRVPNRDDVVSIASGTLVTYDSLVGEAKTIGIQDNATLKFRTDANTRLRVATLLVMPDGTLEVGLSTSPIPADKTAEIVIANQPLHTTDDGQDVFDPSQFGTGIVNINGKLTLHGASKTGFIRLAAEPSAGQSTLRLLSAVNGWAPGDKLVLPDTRQTPPLGQFESPPAWHDQAEEMSIAGLAGTTVTLASPLRFDHPGGRDPDGRLDFLPHVGNLTRNVVIRSENPAGTRGHIFSTYRAEVDVRYVELSGLGRTTAGPLDSTTFNGDGSVAHIGTNQIGRYAFHMHHVLGPPPERPPASGFQYTIQGIAIDESARWGIAIHDTHFGLVRSNVVYNARGSGIVTEDGSETANHIENNFSLVSSGSGEAMETRFVGLVPGGGRLDIGHEGAPFWFRGSHNYITGNIGANSRFADFQIFSFSPDRRRIPLFAGADLVNGVEGTDYWIPDHFYLGALSPLAFSDNEAYGAPKGFDFWSVGRNPFYSSERYTIRDTVAWHTAAGLSVHYMNGPMTVDGYTARGFAGTGAGYDSGGHGNYMNIRRADVQNLECGLAYTQGDGPYGTQPTIEDSYFRNATNLTLISYGFGNVQFGTGPREMTIRNVRFQALPGQPAAHVVMEFRPVAHSIHMTLLDSVSVINFNGQPGNNFRVLYNEQDPDWQLPRSRPADRYFGCPLPDDDPRPGASNRECWNRFGVAFAGAVACLSRRPEIDGFVCPLSAELLGDLNDDGNLDSLDAVILANYLVGNLQPESPPFSAPLSRADMNGDGSVNVLDLVVLLQLLTGGG